MIRQIDPFNDKKPDNPTMMIKSQDSLFDFSQCDPQERARITGFDLYKFYAVISQQRERDLRHSRIGVK